MNSAIKELGLTVRAAITGWGPAIRFCLIVVVLAPVVVLVRSYAL
jgi:hypothetical protein